MATPSAPASVNRLSFAKIAAMPPQDTPHVPAATSDESSTTHHGQTVLHESHDPSLSQSSLKEAQHHIQPTVLLETLTNEIRTMQINREESREGSESSGDGRDNGALQLNAAFDDDQTHLSNSSTKPTSFDSKSMASVTTFAMDEKDSLRPDDSASVQAVDEEDSFSGPASGAPNSVTGSEAGARGYRDLFRESSTQKIRGILSGPHRLPDGNIHITGPIPPDSVSNNFVVPGNEDFQNMKPLHGFPNGPDEKLLEAMNSPKDRLMLLQLEEKVRNFIQDSKEQSLELPPSNAFGRLLAHKLGDYYHLTHFVDNNVTSVRLHRTPFCRLPTPLSMLRPANTNHTPSPSAPAMKIMRRNGANGERPASTAASSSAHSKADSEIGDATNDDGYAGSSVGATPSRDRATMTREEREAKYQEARERIFRDFSENKSSDSSANDNSADISRSSSTSGRKKNFRQRTPHDDTFEARSQYNVYYPGMPYTSGSLPVQTSMHNGPVPGPPSYPPAHSSSPPNINYAHPANNSMMSPSVALNTVPQYPMSMSPHMSQNNSWQGNAMPQQSPYSGYAALHQPSPLMVQQPSNSSSPGMSNYTVLNTSQYQQSPPAWVSSPYSQSPQRTAPVHWPAYPSQPVTSNTPSYPYGQYPAQQFNMPNASPPSHPIPGNYNRSSFNPQTRSFVPGNNSPRLPPKPNPHIAQQPFVNSQPTNSRQWGGYSDNQSSAIPLHTGTKSHPLPTSNILRGPNPAGQGSIAKWGTPSHLPPKPPPSEVPSDFDVNRRNQTASTNTSAYSNPTKTGPLVVSGGTNVSK